MLKKTRTALTVAAAMLTLGAGAQAAYAQEAASAPSATAPSAAAPASMPMSHDMHKGPHRDRHGPPPPRGPRGPGGPGGPGFAHMMDQLHASLHLNASQEAAWKNAQDTSKKNFDTMRTQHDVVQKQLHEASEQPILDLAALQTQRQQLEANDLELRNSTEKAFVDFYATLDDQQKKLVSDSIKQSWKRMMSQHGHRPPPPPRDGAMHGDAPPPPPPADAAAK
jgi:uncharacterized membrane protein